MKAIFLVGGPGSGKDQILRFVTESHPEHNLVEVQLDKLHLAIYSNQDLPELSQSKNIIVNGNAERISAVNVSARVLEAMGYETSLLYVYTTDDVSKSRNDARIARGAKTFTEEQRKRKYDTSVGNLQGYSDIFESFWLFNNSSESGSISEEVTSWLVELTDNISSFLGEILEPPLFRSHAPKPNHPAPPPAEPHKSIIKGYERVKGRDGRWVLRPKQTTESHKYNSLNLAFENYSATAVDNSRGNTNVPPSNSPTENPATVTAKVLTPKNKLKTVTQGGISIPDQKRADPPVWEEKLTPDGSRVAKPTQKHENKRNVKTKGALPPPNFFDGKMGMVPSGSLGITSEFKPSGTPLSELRKKMRK